MSISKRNEWIFGQVSDTIMHDRAYLIRHEIIRMLNKTTQMFTYENLPDTINVKDLETILQIGGFAVWKKVNDELYVFTAGLGGEPNPYYLPTIAIIANPSLKYNASLKIDEECVVMLNDYYYEGLAHLINKYANLIVDGEMTLRQAIINARIPAIMTADNETSVESAKQFFDNIENGKSYGVVLDVEAFDGIKAYDFQKYSQIKDIIESIQYLKGNFYNEIGINATFNMKREAINEFEAGLNEDLLIPFIDTMLECREKGIEKVNKMYNTNIKVRLNSVWEKNRKADEVMEEYKEAETELLKSETKSEEDTENADY